MTTAPAAPTPPVPLLDSEQVRIYLLCRYLLTTPAHMGYNPINGGLWLTNHRLIFKPGPAVGRMGGVIRGASGARTVWFPVRRVTEAGEQPMKVSLAFGKPNVLRLQFDNGGREYFELVNDKTTPIGVLSAAITGMATNAADLSYDAVPELKSGFELPAGSGARRMMLYWVIGLVVLCVACSVIALTYSALSK